LTLLMILQPYFVSVARKIFPYDSCPEYIYLRVSFDMQYAHAKETIN